MRKNVQKVIVVCLSVMLLASVSSASTYRGSGPWEDIYDGTHGWIPAVPTSADTARINWGDNTVTLDYAAPDILGLQAGVDESGTLHINDGGSLTALGNSKIGNNNVCTGTLIIDAGGSMTNNGWLMVAGNSVVTGVVEVNGTLNLNSHLWAATGADSTATIDINDGGVINLGGMIGLGTVNAVDPSGGTATLNVNSGGLLSLSNIHSGIVNDPDTGNSIQPGSMLNINGTGRVTLPGNFVNQMTEYAAVGAISGNGVVGNVEATYDVGTDKTTITAILLDGTPPTPDPASFASAPAAIGTAAISMTATTGSDDSGSVEYYFDETSGELNGTDSGWITSNSYTDTDLTAATTYTYTVTMRDASGNETAASAGASATTWAATTTNITWDPSSSNPSNWADPANWKPAVAGRPDGNFKCYFKETNAAECVVSGPHIFQSLRQGSSGPGGVIRVVDGGKLTTMGSWMSIGFNNTAKLIVETGGECDFGGHLWWAMNNGADAIIEINGGTITGGADFGLGWHDGAPSSGTATAKVYVNSGTLNIHHWNGTGAIQVGSFIDIESGSVTILGDRTGDVAGYVTAGKITAYGGTGRVVYDYNVTNTGKTTIKAIEGVDGDIDVDGDVDTDDLFLFVLAWLGSDCDSEANFDEYCIISLPDFAVLAANWMSGYITNWHVASTLYPTDDTIVTPHYAANLGIVADGTTDVTDAIQSALISISNLGGGALFLPAGNYKVSGTLTIPAKVTLRGDWQKPVPGSPIVGTILQAYAGRNDENGTPFIELSGSSGVNGITIWYPEQLPTDIQPYPPTIHGGGATVENVTFVNSYFGFTTYREGTTARPFTRNIYGTPLKTGIEYDCLADIGRIETVHFSPDYWADSGLPNAPTAGEHEAWIYDNGTGMIVRRIDWSYSCYVTVEGYNIGLALRPGRFDGKHPNGQSYMFTLTDCETGIYIEANSYAGYQFTRFDIQGAQTGVYMSNSYDEATMFHTCSINASGDAVYNQGMAKALMMSCDIQQGTLDFDGGYLSVINSDFTSTTTNHIELASGVHGASILGNTFAGSARISDSTSYPVNIDHTPLTVDPMPAYDYKKPETGYNAAKSDLYVVTKSPYYAQADGTTDDTAAFQAALADADANGGGIVFVPGGNYRLDGNLTIPTGVELKGVFDIPHGTRDKGSLLNVYAGRNNASGTPFIQIESGAGIRGLSFHYPEQIYDGGDTVNYGMVPYPYMIRGLGSDVYVINIAATIPYQLLDLATDRCDRHYVDYIMSTALKTGIHVGNGSTDGQIHNCQFNPSAYTHQGSYYESIPHGTSSNIHAILWRDATPYLFGNMSGEVLHENFVFGGVRGFHLVEEGGFGPSGYCMGMGVDQCTNALQIDDIGSGGLDMINSQIVTVNATAGRYLETGASFDDTFRMFGSAGWGSHQYSAVINGGDVKLQLFHLARDGESGAFKVLNNASLQNLGGNLTDYLGLGRPFLTINPTATAEFIGNIINTDPSQMPTNTSNVTSIGNLRVQ